MEGWDEDVSCPFKFSASFRCQSLLDEVTFFRDSLALPLVIVLQVDDQGRTELFEPELRREFHPSSFNTRMSLWLIPWLGIRKWWLPSLWCSDNASFDEQHSSWAPAATGRTCFGYLIAGLLTICSRFTRSAIILSWKHSLTAAWPTNPYKQIVSAWCQNIMACSPTILALTPSLT